MGNGKHGIHTSGSDLRAFYLGSEVHLMAVNLQSLLLCAGTCNTCFEVHRGQRNTKLSSTAKGRRHYWFGCCCWWCLESKVYWRMEVIELATKLECCCYILIFSLRVIECVNDDRCFDAEKDLIKVQMRNRSILAHILGKYSCTKPQYVFCYCYVVKISTLAATEWKPSMSVLSSCSSTQSTENSLKCHNVAYIFAYCVAF